MLPREFYSKGFNAMVFEPSDRERMLYCSAGLVREERNNDPTFSRRLYYTHRIASLLFPSRFIEVIAATSIPDAEGYIHQLFSDKAAVEPGHKTYAAHFERVGGIKVPHICESCREHQAFHNQNNLRQQFLIESEKMKAAGITPDGFLDPSDYCLGPRGIVLFEIEHLDMRKVQDYIDFGMHQSRRAEEAGALWRRLMQLKEESGNWYRVQPKSEQRKWFTDI